MPGKRFHGKKAYAKKRKYKPSYNKGRGKKMPAMAGKDQFATVIETVEWPDMKINDFGLYNFNLAQFPRAQLMSGLFRFYKASKVIWQVQPLYDTFQAGVNACRPYIYTMMNRDQSAEIQNFATSKPGGAQLALTSLQAMGARSKPLDDKVIKYIYKPNWCSPGLQGTISSSSLTIPVSLGLQKQYGWLATSVNIANGAVANLPNANAITLPGVTGGGGTATGALLGHAEIAPNSSVFPNANFANSVVYNGHACYVDQTSPTGEPPTAGTIIARVTCSVQWKFKGPRYNLQPYPPNSAVV